MAALGCSVIAAVSDDLEHAQKMQEQSGANFPIAYGITQADAAAIGAWWSDERGGFIQPAEFILGRGGTVLGSLYASGPVGRMSAAEALYMITRRESRRR